MTQVKFTANIFICILLCFFFTTLVCASVFMPHGFYGTVSNSDGVLIQDGFIRADINGNSFFSTVSDGAYDLVVETEYPEIITFYLNDKFLADFIFGNSGDVTNLDFVTNFNFIYACGNNILDSGEECDDGNILNNDGCSSSCLIEADGSYSSILIKSSNKWKPYGVCEPNWECNTIGDCEGSIAKRSCVDTNFCGLSYNKPSDTAPCEITLSSLIEKSSEKKFGNWNVVVWIAIFLVLILIILWTIIRTQPKYL